MSTAEEKLDFLIKSVAAIREDQAAINDKVADNQHNLDNCFRKLEKDVVAAQEDATERAIKRARRESDLWSLKTEHIKSSSPSTRRWQTMSEQRRRK